MRHVCAPLLFAATLAVGACAAEPPLVEFDELVEPMGPQVAPGDPCNGVVPQLCPV